MKNVLIIVVLLLSLKSYGTEKDLYDFLWLDPDKSVYVLQNKIHKKKGSFYFDVSGIKDLSADFQKTYGMNVKLGHFFHEEWGVEFQYSTFSHKNNSAFDNIKALNGSEPFIRRFEDSFSLLGIWSPFYGKINTFNKIFYFDWMFGLGLSQINSETNINTVQNPNIPSRFDKESHTALTGKTTFRFYMNETWHLDLEYKTDMFMAPGPRQPNQDDFRTNSNLMIGIGMSF